MIKTIEGNKVISDKGIERFVFNLNANDLEQLESTQIVSSINNLKSDLNNLPSNKSFKFYHINNSTYFDSGLCSPTLRGMKRNALELNLAPWFFGKNVFSNPVFKGDYLKINGSYLRFIHINMSEDHQIDVAGFQRFSDYFIVFERIKNRSSKMLINDARKVSHTDLYKALSDIEGIEAYKENEKMLQDLITGQECLYKFETHFIVSAETEKDLKQKTDAVINALESAGLGPKIVTNALNRIFLNYTVGLAPKMNAPQFVPSSFLCNTIPFHKDKLHRNGVKFHSRSMHEIHLDLMQGDSFSVGIFGTTGKGKTQLTNKLLAFEINRGRVVFVIDPKGDYLKHAILKGAYILEDIINPMIFDDPKYLHSLILSKIPKTERNKKFEGSLLRVIKNCGASKTGDFKRSLEILEQNGFEDLSLYFEDIEEFISTDKQEFSPFIYVNFKTFPNESIPFILAFSFEYLKRIGKEYCLVIDEAHRVFKQDPDFLEERVREMRVLNSSLITITQNFGDLVKNHFGQVVADNSYHKIFFTQTVKEGEGGLTSFDRSQIESLETVKGEYSEFYYKSDVNKKVVRYYASLKDLEVYGSEDDTQKMLQFIKDNQKYFTVDSLVNQWVEGKYA